MPRGSKKTKAADKEAWEKKRSAPPLTAPAPPPAPPPPAEPICKEPPLNPDNIGDADMIRILKAISCYDPGRILRTDGTLVPFTEMDYWTRIVIAGLESSELFGISHGDKPPDAIGILRKFKMSDRMKAMDLLWKYEGKMSNDNARGARQQDRLNEVIAAMKEGPVDPKAS